MENKELATQKLDQLITRLYGATTWANRMADAEQLTGDAKSKRVIELLSQLCTYEAGNLIALRNLIAGNAK